jgi:hypothetical protein
MTKIRTALKGRRGGIILCGLFILSIVMTGCSNPGNSLDTGIVKKGFITSGQPNAKWMYMDDDAVILLKSGNEGKLYFKGLVDQNLLHSGFGDAFAMTFVVNGDPVKVITINKVYDGYFDVVCDIPKNTKIELHIKVDKYDTSRKDGARISMIAYSLDAK